MLLKSPSFEFFFLFYLSVLIKMFNLFTFSPVLVYLFSRTLMLQTE